MTKKRLRENYMLKEQRKVESEVFDKETLKSLAKLIKKGIIASVDFPISTGKEANVFSATTPSSEHVAIKIYKIETTPFFRREEYLEGDPRFTKIKKNNKDVIIAFARKEYKNLQICEQAGVHAPKPFYCERNILVMSLIGDQGLPYPTMNVQGPRNADDLEILLKDIKKMYKAGLVHADLSEYNVILGELLYIIDFGQGVVIKHPNAERFLERDVKNILNYFAKFGYKKDFEETMKWMQS